MRVYKERSFLVFELDDGGVVKYDFATKKSIGKRGHEVVDLRTQLKNISIEQIIASCEDTGYGLFLRWVMNEHGKISNIGTILEYTPAYSRFEQFFSAGVQRVSRNLAYRISELPTGLIQLCRDKNLLLNQEFADVYMEMPNEVRFTFDQPYTSLTKDDIFRVFTNFVCNSTTNWGRVPYVRHMRRYGYTVRPLFSYLDYLKTYEAIEEILSVIRELMDYARMMYAINPRFEKYPKHFLTTHRIAARNYNRLKTTFNEESFKRRRVPQMECVIGNYAFIYPKTTQDIKDEAVMQNNCVASYIQSVIDGSCHILFMRRRDAPDTSLVTLEVVDGKIVQAKQHYNYNVTQEQEDAIESWNRWYAKKLQKTA